MQKRHILVIDDDPTVGSFVADHLLAEGHIVLRATTCAEAKDMLRGSTVIDLVLLDHFLPDESGIALLTAMSNDDSLQKPPIVISSSCVHPDDKSWQEIFQRLPPLSQSLVRAYLPKPYPWDALNTLLEKFFPTRSQPHTA